MPFSRPTLSALRQQARQYFAARLPGADTTLRRSNITVAADTIAALLWSEYGYLDWIAQQLFPDTAETGYLERWASIFGLTRASASFASGNVVFGGIAGTPVPEGLIVQAGDGQQFATTASATLAGSPATATIAVDAEIAGAAGNEAANAPVTLVSAIAGVSGTAAFDGAGSTGGVDQESDASLRNRLLLRIQQPPQGGDANDYIEWALAVPGVTRAWVYPLNRGAGTVDLAFVMDGRTNIIPTPTDVALVQAAIDAKRPVTADSVVFAPIATPLNLTIGELTPNTAAVQAAILAEYTDLLMRDASPGGTIYFSRIDEAISAAAGEQHHLLTSPSADFTPATGHIAVVGTISYV